MEPRSSFSVGLSSSISDEELYLKRKTTFISFPECLLIIFYILRRSAVVFFLCLFFAVFYLLYTYSVSLRQVNVSSIKIKISATGKNYLFSLLDHVISVMSIICKKNNMAHMGANASAAHLHLIIKTFYDISAWLLHDLINMLYYPILQLLSCS